MIEKLLNHTLVRYILVGGISFAAELALLLLFTGVFDIQRTIATAVTFWVGLILAFVLQKLFAFKDYQKDLRAISRQGVSYGLLVAWNYTFTLFVVSVFPSRYLVFSRVLAVAITTVWNYFIYRKVIFSPHRNKGSLLKHDVGLVLSIIRRRWLLIVGLSIPVILFNWQYLTSGGKLIGGDFDYYAQMYEAFRITVLKYHQFPLWNPWMAGGLPLFANPQFGLFSLQSLLVLPLGTIFGLKLAYIIYALLGFWGMFTLCRLRFTASITRSALVSYLWIFCGFFASHNISHFTFALFFLFPWLIFFLTYWRRKYSWLYFGALISLIALSSVHYALLMMGVAVALFCLYWFFTSAGWRNLTLLRLKTAALFAAKSFAVIGLVAGYRVVTTYLFVHANSRPAGILEETPPTISILFQALFVPIQTVLTPPQTHWGWGEYSMYLGIGTGLALAAIIVILVIALLRKKATKQRTFAALTIILAIVLLGCTTAILALGDFSKFSPFNILRELPGFSETRVPSRWLLFTGFSILALIASFKPKSRLINVFLVLAVVELFVSYGPLSSKFQQATISLPEANYSTTFSQYDNDRNHLNLYQVINNSYYYSTSRNIGQIYADDSLINTLNNVLPTTRCGENINPSCDLVTSDNAYIVFWSPNRIVLERTEEGPISLNMNREAGWTVNGTYVFADRKNLDPSLPFTITDNTISKYELVYQPRLSPTWFGWKVDRSL